MERDPDEPVHPGQEDLKWGAGVKDKDRKKGSTPSAKYNKFSEQARRLMAGESQCAMFCGGKKCKYCTADNWRPDQMVIKGLYSEWVTDNILAMARPSNHGFDTCNTLGQFVENNIKTVINLQQTGEHASCGYGNDASGFSYNPQRLMEKEIYFYNFAWQDYGIAPMSTLLDIVKVMQFGVSMGKVAVHCHAGLGRTGLLIACYLVYNNRVDAGEAVHYVRSRRAGAIQTSQQVQTVYDFETHLKPFRTIFPSKVSGENEVSFKHFLNRQNHMIHGFEARRLKHIPKVVYLCCERLLELAGRGQALSKVYRHPPTFPPSSSSASSSSTQPSKTDTLPSLSQLSVHSENDLSTLSERRALRGSVSFEDLTNNKFKKVLSDAVDDDNSSDTTEDVFGTEGQELSMPEAQPAGKAGGEESEEDDDDCIVFGKPDVVVVPAGTDKNQCGDDEGAGTPVDNPVCSDKPKSNPTLDTSKPDQLLSVPKLPDQSLSATTDPNTEHSHSHNGTESRNKRKVKQKGFGERFKGRAKKKEAANNSTPNSEDTSHLKGEKGEGVAEEDEKSLASEQSSDPSGKSSSDSSGSSLLPVSTVPAAGSDELSRSVCDAMAASEYSADVRKRADHIEVQLNETDKAWSLLAKEKDPHVLSAVFWDWLNQLKESVLRRQDLTLLLEHSESPRDSLHHLEKSVKHFIEYQAVVLSKLFPQSEDLETRLTERLLSHLTHNTVALHLSSFTHHPNQPPHWGEMRSNEASCLIGFFFKLIDQVAAPRKSQGLS